MYAALTSNRARYAPLYKALGIEPQSEGPCDKLTVSGAETSAPDITTADLVELNLVAAALASGLGIQLHQTACAEGVTDFEGPITGRAGMGLMDAIHLSLDVVGLGDPLPFCDGINCRLYLAQFRFTDAGISAAGLIPCLGDAAKSDRPHPGIGVLACHRSELSVRDHRPVSDLHHRWRQERRVGGRRVYFDMGPDDYRAINEALDDSPTQALNRDAMDILGAAARQGDPPIVVYLNRIQSLEDLFLDCGSALGTKRELFHLAREYGLEVGSNRTRDVPYNRQQCHRCL